MWKAMVMTFNDLYQGLTEDDVPLLTKVNDKNAPAPNNMKDNDPQLNEFRNKNRCIPFSQLSASMIDISRLR